MIKNYLKLQIQEKNNKKKLKKNKFKLETPQIKNFVKKMRNS